MNTKDEETIRAQTWHIFGDKAFLPKESVEKALQSTREDERNRIAALCYQLETDGQKTYDLIFNDTHAPTAWTEDTQ